MDSVLLEVCKGTLQQRILPAFVEKIAQMGKKMHSFAPVLNKLTGTDSVKTYVSVYLRNL